MCLNNIIFKNVFNKYKVINMLKRKVDLILESWKITKINIL